MRPYGLTNYSRWWKMLDRCYNPNAENYSRYGGRGITVCEDWQDYHTYSRAIGSCPAPGYTIDRIDNNKGYYPENCRWASKKTQAYNKHNTRIWDWGGESLTLAEWSKILEISISTLDSCWNRTSNILPPRPSEIWHKYVNKDRGFTYIKINNQTSVNLLDGEDEWDAIVRKWGPK